MSKHELHRVTSLEIAAPYKLRVGFEDGDTHIIDFSEILFGEIFTPLRDLSFFNRVDIDPKFIHLSGQTAPTSTPRRYTIGIDIYLQ